MLIRDSRTGKVRQTEDFEDRDISEHLNDYPKCNGTRIVDAHDQTTWTARPYLWCEGCDVKVDPA